MSDLEEALVGYRKEIMVRLQAYANARSRKEESIPVLRDIRPNPVERPIETLSPPIKPVLSNPGPRPAPIKNAGKPEKPKDNTVTPKNQAHRGEAEFERGSDHAHPEPQQPLGAVKTSGEATPIWKRWRKRVLISGVVATAGGFIFAVIYYLFVLL